MGPQVYALQEHLTSGEGRSPSLWLPAMGRDTCSALHAETGCSIGVQDALEGTACCITTTDTFDTHSKSAWPNHRWMWELPGSVPWQHSSLCPPTSTMPCRQAVSPVIVLFSYHDGAPLYMSVCEVQQQLQYIGLRCIAVAAGSASGDTAPMVGPRSISYLPSFCFFACNFTWCGIIMYAPCRWRISYWYGFVAQFTILPFHQEYADSGECLHRGPCSLHHYTLIIIILLQLVNRNDNGFCWPQELSQCGPALAVPSRTTSSFMQSSR